MSKRERAMVPPATPRSYYGQPVIHPPIWSWEIGAYLFVGGLAGASGLVAGGARLAGNVPLAQRASALALAGAVVSPVLLISDLGRPERFLRMLRVFKPTSPMSVGTWILSTLGPSAGVAAGWQLVGFPPKGWGVPAQVATSITGPLLSTYTGALLAQTAVPVWHDARRELPYLFTASSLASAGGALAAITPPAAAGPARTLAVGGAIAELGIGELMERRLDPRIRASYEAPTVQAFHRAARALTAAGAVTIAAAGARSRSAAIGGGLALCAGAALTRWALFKAGSASAADPEQTVGPQRERRDAHEAAAA
ncbi:MAG: NrfD/PsrC family molybdoenzyme membrane anchor subunit [Solirubrobacteraceae bacterium]